MNDEQIKVSIIIPIYNAEKYIEQCIASVWRQTLKELEVICIDDGSTDDSYRMLCKIKEQDSRIKVLRQANQGSGAARNYGLKEANGTYVAFLDIDDFYYEKDALEIMADACEIHKVNICGSYRKMLEDYEIRDHALFRDFEIPEKTGMLIKFADFQNDFDYQSFLFRRSFLQENHLRFPEYRRYQDPVFFLRAMHLAQEFWVMPVTLYCYRNGHQNKKANADQVLHTLRAIRDNLLFAKEHNYTKLYNTTIERIESWYGLDILGNMTDEVLAVFSEINKINEGRKSIRFDKLQASYYNIMDSFALSKNIVKILQSDYGFREYFQEKRIHKVAVYGLGAFGEILMTELKRSGVEVVGCIDRKVPQFGEFEVIKPGGAVSEYDRLIVTPIPAGEILEQYQNWKNVITFQEIVDEIREIEKQRCDTN